jgi:hypothetical protein
MTTHLPVLGGRAVEGAGCPAGTFPEPLPDASPLEAMLENLRFWRAQCESLGRQLDALTVADGDADAERTATALVREFLSARSRAQQCAVEAAPYVHGRQSPTTASPIDGDGTYHVTMTIPPPRPGEDRSYRNSP